ncbi:MAG: preprotein translocase subunit YajC [Sphaerochaetaceae bacterium]|nr:preprotein translocase subunit YajC [Spirochaetales bacterium]MDY5500560.1 preprotein translocase subunit YajC [Sphaerochaetaceae bacterium]
MLNFMMSADAAGSSTGSMATTMITFVLIILIFYFLMIRPQRKRDKETQAMLSAMKKGDKVVSIGGIHGTVVAVKESSVIVKVDDNTRIEFSKNAISQVLNKKEVASNPKAEKKAGQKAEEKSEPKTEESAAEEPKKEN